jgi:hypothetical protein
MFAVLRSEDRPRVTSLGCSRATVTEDRSVVHTGAMWLMTQVLNQQ